MMTAKGEAKRKYLMPLLEILPQIAFLSRTPTVHLLGAQCWLFSYEAQCGIEHSTSGS